MGMDIVKSHNFSAKGYVRRNKRVFFFALSCARPPSTSSWSACCAGRDSAFGPGVAPAPQLPERSDLAACGPPRSHRKEH